MNKDGPREPLSERDAVAEQADDVAEARLRGRVARLLSAPAESSAPSPTERVLVGLGAGCPPRFRPWLERHALAFARGSDYVTDRFFREVQRVGLVRAVLLNMNEDDADAKDRRRGAMNCLPDRDIAWDVIRFALDTEEDYWRKLAAKWAPEYAPDEAAAVELLAGRLRDGRGVEVYHAALHLARIAPDAPGLVDRLAEGLAADWIASNDRHYRDGGTGADAVVGVLPGLGRRAATVLPALRSAVLAGRCVDPGAAVAAYVDLGGAPADLSDLLPGLRDEIAGGGWGVGDRIAGYVRLGGDLADLLPRLPDRAPDGWWAQQLLAAVVALPADSRGASAVLARLLRTPGVEAATPHDRAAGLDRLAAGCGAEDFFPAVARHLEPPAGGDAPGAGPLAAFLARLRRDPAGRSAEDQWVTAVGGKPADDVAWLVYADWLEERGDPRAAYLRLRHAAADAAAWLAERGAGWAEVYDAVGR